MTLTAIPSPGWVFSGWSGQTEGISDVTRNPARFEMGDDPDNNRQMTASFVQSDVRCTLTAIVAPTAGGSISPSVPPPAGGYLVNQSLSLIAVPGTGYVFSHWTGSLTGDQATANILMSNDKTVTAVFYPTVKVSTSSSEMGTVSPQPTPNGYAPGTEVTFTATPSKGYRFVSWGGDASGRQKSITLKVGGPKTITASFAAKSPSRWWLWLIIGVAGLAGALILVRVVYARMNRGWADEPPPDQ